MIVVGCAIMQDRLKKIVESCSEYEFKFVKKEGINQYFEVNTEDIEKAAAVAKKAIKADPAGNTLLVSVKAVQ